MAGEAALDFKGRPVLVNFWATCGARPASLNIPCWSRWRVRASRLSACSIRIRRASGRRRSPLVRDGNPFKHIGLDPLGDLGIDIGISGVPESFLIDANGQIVKTKRNYFTQADVADFVAAYRAGSCSRRAAARQLALSGAPSRSPCLWVTPLAGRNRSTASACCWSRPPRPGPAASS